MNATDLVYLRVIYKRTGNVIVDNALLQFDTALEVARQQAKSGYSWQIVAYTERGRVVIAESISPDAEARMSSSEPPQIAPDIVEANDYDNYDSDAYDYDAYDYDEYEDEEDYFYGFDEDDEEDEECNDQCDHCGSSELNYLGVSQVRAFSEHTPMDSLVVLVQVYRCNDCGKWSYVGLPKGFSLVDVDKNVQVDENPDNA